MAMRAWRETMAAHPLAWALAALSLGLAACEESAGAATHGAGAAREERRAEAVAPPRPGPERPPRASPGAAPSAARLIGTWTVTEFKGGPADGRGDHAATTTYRFQEAGRVTVAGEKQCAYTFDGAELKVDCEGKLTTGKIEFRGDQTVLWNIGKDQIVTLTKR